MKNMNVIPLILSLIMMFSCSDHEILNDPNILVAETKNSQEESEYLFEIEIHYLSSVSKINTLNEEKEEVLMAIEKGDKSAVERLENIQKELQNLNEFKKYLLKLPGGIKLPPKGCLVISNCDPQRDLTRIKGIILNDNFKTSSTEILNSKNALVGKGTEIIKNNAGQRVLLFETNYSGNGFLQMNSSTANFGKIESTIPMTVSK